MRFFGAACAAVVLLTLVALLVPTSWRSKLVAPAVPAGPHAALDRPGETACAAVDEVPASARNAEFRVTGASRLRARADVRRNGRLMRGRPSDVPVIGGVARLPMPRGGATGAPADVCLRSLGGGPFTVLGDGGSAALRLVGAAPQSRLSTLDDELVRAGRAKGAPFRGIAGWAALVLALGALGGAVVIAVRAWGRADGWRPSRRVWASVAVVGVLHAWAWAAVVPPFQVPDETSHLQYVSYVAEHGSAPTGRLGDGRALSESQRRAEKLVRTDSVAFRPTLRPPWSRSADQRLHAELVGVSTHVPDGRTNATAQPPLYYLSVALAAVGGGDALDVLSRVRLLSGLWLGIAALGAMALLRAVAPGRGAVAVTGGLGVALFPLLGFLGGGVTPDVAMTALSLWLYAAAVTCWRCGTSARGLAIFGILALLLATTKLTALAVLPGAALVVAAAVVRDARRSGVGTVWRSLRAPAAAAAVVLAAYVTYTLWSGRPVVPGDVGNVATGGAAGPAGPSGGLREAAVSTWQLFLPRLPFMHEMFEGSPLTDVWLGGLVGRFGYLDYGFSDRVQRIVGGVVILTAVAAAVAFVRIVRGVGTRTTIKRHGPVLLGGALAVLLLVAIIGRVDFDSRRTGGPPFQQARYLLPALPVAVLVLPLALRGLGRRVAPFVGVALVSGAALWAAGALGLTLQRYYG